MSQTVRELSQRSKYVKIYSVFGLKIQKRYYVYYYFFITSNILIFYKIIRKFLKILENEYSNTKISNFKIMV